jgi:hypothetical protein
MRNPTHPNSTTRARASELTRASSAAGPNGRTATVRYCGEAVGWLGCCARGVGGRCDCH